MEIGEIECVLCVYIICSACLDQLNVRLGLYWDESSKSNQPNWQDFIFDIEFLSVNVEGCLLLLLMLLLRFAVFSVIYWLNANKRHYSAKWIELDVTYLYF